MTEISQSSLNFDSDEDLSEDQVQALLKEAEERLRERAGNLSSSISLSERQTKLPKLNAGDVSKPYVENKNGIAHADASRLLSNDGRRLANGIRRVEDPVAMKKKKLEKQKASTGPQWYNMPKTDLTPELKRDLQLIQMRGVLDPHRHYKKESGKAKAPEFSQIGTIIEGATEFYSARIQNKDRKRTFVDEVLAAEAQSGRFKKKATDIQLAKSSGKKRHYKEMKEKRKSKYKTG